MFDLGTTFAGCLGEHPLFSLEPAKDGKDKSTAEAGCVQQQQQREGFESPRLEKLFPIIWPSSWPSCNQKLLASESSLAALRASVSADNCKRALPRHSSSLIEFMSFEPDLKIAEMTGEINFVFCKLSRTTPFH